MGRDGGAEGPQERLQSLAAMERMLREEEGLGERSSDEFKRNKGDRESGGRERSFRIKEEIDRAKQRWRRGTERRKKETKIKEKSRRRRWWGKRGGGETGRIKTVTAI